MRQIKTGFALLVLTIISIKGFSQSYQSYYLPEKTIYNPKISLPETIIGFPVGERHLSYEQFLRYAQTVAAQSGRVVMETQGFTYERKPTALLVVTHPENHARLDEILAAHQQLSDPNNSKKLDTDEMPVVIWMGYSVHGNEASGFNATPLWLYHLAAAEGKSIENQLKKAIILIDPCLNPDGTNRFASWVNSHRSQTLVTDGQSREFDEAWPNGRTNHYWFDLNRDWLPAQHPESQGRLANFQKWKPNVLTDHHEMGTGSTFFFQPGIPSRNHPLTPKKNTELTEKIAGFHAKALDSLGSLYYSEESFDDFYYGKGSTYPDVQGSVGVLFEQASARGHAQESQHGTVTFPFAIRNQLAVSFSTFAAAVRLRKELLNYQRNFYQDALKEASESPIAAYAFGTGHDPARMYHFMKMLESHGIEMYAVEKKIGLGNQVFAPKSHFVVPMAQPQSRLIKALFQTQTEFKDSLFYDVSAWTMPLAFGLDYAPLSQKELNKISTSTTPLKSLSFPQKELGATTSNIGYAFSWSGYYAPRAAYRLLKAGVLLKTAKSKWTAETAKGNQSFGYGSIVVPLGIQVEKAEQILKIMQEIAEQDGVEIHALTKGQAVEGIDLGSPSFEKLRLPRVGLIVGTGISPYEAGEVWHLLDQRYQMPVTLLPAEKMGQTDLSKYNVLIMVNGSYQLSSSSEKIKIWVSHGNTLLVTKNATQWAVQTGLSSVEWKKKSQAENSQQRPYEKYEKDKGAQRVGGAIFEASLDLSHPLCYGFSNSNIPVFRNHTLFAAPKRSPYATPIRYTESPLLSGYISAENLELAGKSAAAWVSSYGSGRVICLLDNPNFRAFWYGTNKFTANAIFFGHTVEVGSTR